MARLKIADQIILAVFLIAGLLIFLSVSPSLEAPGRDSGAFLYVGQAITRGLTPYVDVWDHKGIIVYWVNAAASLLSPNSTWGIWIIDFILLVVDLVVSFRLTRRLFGLLAALWVGLAWLFTMPFLKFLNFTEFYALPLQFLALYSFYASTDNTRDRKYAALLGIVFALAFFIRANLVAVFGAIILYWLWNALKPSKRKAALRRFIHFSVGAATVGIFLVVYFLITHSLEAMIDALFRYNVIYAATSGSLTIRTAAMLHGFSLLSYSGLSFLGAAGWLAGAILLLRQRTAMIKLHAVVIVALIALPIEIAFSSLTDASYPHYYITWIPTFSLLGAFFIRLIQNQLRKTPQRLRPAAFGFFGALAILGIGFAPLLGILNIYYTLHSPHYDVSNAVKIVKAETSAGDTLLVWGAESEVNYLTGLPAPTRYMYQYPLFLQGYENPARFEEFLIEIQRNPPKLVIDASASSAQIPPLDAELRSRWRSDDPIRYVVNSDVDPVFQYFAENYRFLAKTDYTWDVYIRRDQS